MKIDRTREFSVIRVLTIGMIISVSSLIYLGVSGNNLVTSINIAAWGIVVFRLMFLLGGELYLKKPQWYVFALWLISGILAQVHCYLICNYFNIMDMFRLMITSIIILFIYGMDWVVCFDYVSLKRIFFTLFFWGAISSIYATYTQKDSILAALRGDFISNWFYRAFYSTRNVFAVLCVFSCFATMYFYYMTQRKCWIIFMLFLVFQVILTNSRNALLMLIVFWGMLVILSFSAQNRMFIYISLLLIGVMMLFVIFNTDFLVGFLGGRLLHVHDGEETTQIRFVWWQDVFRKLINEHTIILGYGDGYAENYLWEKYNVGSTHNVYIDLIFKGGIIRLILYIVIIVNSFSYIKNISIEKIKKLWIAMFTSIICHSVFDSFGILFSTSYYSFFTTIIVVFLPRYISIIDEDVYIGNEKQFTA